MKKIIKTIGWTLLALLVCYGLEVLFRALFGLALHKGMTKQEQIRVQIMANFILKLVVLFVFGFWYAVRENKWHYRPDYRPLFTVKRDWAVWTVCDWHHRWIFAVSSAKHICFL